MGRDKNNETNEPKERRAYRAPGSDLNEKFDASPSFLKNRIRAQVYFRYRIPDSDSTKIPRSTNPQKISENYFPPPLTADNCLCKNVHK